MTITQLLNFSATFTQKDNIETKTDHNTSIV